MNEDDRSESSRPQPKVTINVTQQSIQHQLNRATRAQLDVDAAPTDITTEVRWFIDGHLPPAVEDWFTVGGSLGWVERRHDLYRTDRMTDTGVKQRSGKLLELKLRLGDPKRLELPPGVDGQLEVWERWSPADGVVTLDPDTAWRGVRKQIVKRRFAPEGAEIALSADNRTMEGTACDAEVVAVTIGDRALWSLAFASFGPFEQHVSLIEGAWSHLLASTPHPRELQLNHAVSCGYPEYLVRHCAT